MRLLLLLPLFACTGEKPEDTDEADADTDTDSDTDTDTDTDVDTLVVVPEDAVAFEGSTLALYRLNAGFSAVVGEDPAQAVALADGRYTIEWTPTELEEAPYAEGMFVATYALLAAQDGEDGALLGISRYDALYVTGEIPTQYAEIGIVAGWNALSARGEGDPPVVVDPLAVPLESNLVSQDTVTVGGTWDVPVGDVAVVADIDPSVAVAEGEAADPWSLTVTGRPPSTTLRTETGVTFGGYRPTAYTDVDGDGAWSTGDTVDGLATVGGDPAWLLWGEPVETADQAHTLVTLGGFRVGWGLAYQREIAFPIAGDAANDWVLATP